MPQSSAKKLQKKQIAKLVRSQQRGSSPSVKAEVLPTEVPKHRPTAESKRIYLKIDVDMPWGRLFKSKAYWVHKDIARVLCEAGDAWNLTPRNLLLRNAMDLALSRG